MKLSVSINLILIAALPLSSVASSSVNLDSLNDHTLRPIP